MKIFKLFLKQFFCNHSFELVNKDEVFPSPPVNGAISFVRPHVCTKCEHKKNIGSGLIWG